MRKKLLIALPLVSAVMFSGCATLFGGGGKQTILIKSEKPVRASIGYATDDNKTATQTQSFTTPATLTMVRENKNLLIKSENGEFKPVVVEKKLNGWFWGDVIATSLLSTTVDAITGAMWKYDENITIPTK